MNNNDNKMSISFFEGSNGRKIMVKKQRKEDSAPVIPHAMIDENDSCNGNCANYRFSDSIDCQWKLSEKCQHRKPQREHEQSKRKFSKKIGSRAVPGIMAAYTGEYPSFDCCVDCLEELCKELRKIEKNPKLLNIEKFWF